MYTNTQGFHFDVVYSHVLVVSEHLWAMYSRAPSGVWLPHLEPQIPVNIISVEGAQRRREVETEKKYRFLCCCALSSLGLYFHWALILSHLNVLVASYPTRFDQVIFFFNPKGRCVGVVRNPVILVCFPLEDPASPFREVL